MGKLHKVSVIWDGRKCSPLLLELAPLELFYSSFRIKSLQARTFDKFNVTHVDILSCCCQTVFCELELRLYRELNSFLWRREKRNLPVFEVCDRIHTGFCV